MSLFKQLGISELIAKLQLAQEKVDTMSNEDADSFFMDFQESFIRLRDKEAKTLRLVEYLSDTTNKIHNHISGRNNVIRTLICFNEGDKEKYHKALSQAIDDLKWLDKGLRITIKYAETLIALQKETE
jgi:hypothetical protein